MPYTNQNQIERRFSESGVMLRLDDLDPSDFQDALDDCIGDADDLIDQYCQYFYETEDLEGSSWVHRRASWLACYFLSIRRGNPALFQSRYNEILDDLERVSEGKLLIPGIPTRADFTPALSNLVVDERFHINKIRVQPAISTGGTSGRQSLSPVVPYEWL